MATFNGGAGADEYVGTSSADTINGNGGDDVLQGMGGNDVISGGIGHDVLTGDAGNDTLNGDSGDDILEGMIGDDIISGGDGQDILIGDAGNDTLNGGAGDDFLFDDAGNDTLNGGIGFDIAFYEFATAGVVVNLSLTGAQNTVGAGSDTLTGIEGLSGSTFDDTLTGDANANLLEGDAGADILSGGDGDDTIQVVETMHVVAGERYIGGAGYDTLYLSNPADVSAAIIDADIEELFAPWGGVQIRAGQLANFKVIEAGSISITAAGVADLRFTELINTPTFNLAVGGITLNLAGSATNVYTVSGSSGADVITGGALGDTLRGYAGDDTIYGDGGNDYIEAGEGLNTVHGGAGHDQIWGGASADLLEGDADSDFIQGGDGADTLRGGIGSDYLYGQWGDDTLEGGDGDDTLRDDAGTNNLYGEAGADKFYLEHVSGLADGGIGDDTFEVTIMVAVDLDLVGGAGDDYFKVSGNAYLSGLSISGGDGIDTLEVGGGDISSLLAADIERVIANGPVTVNAAAFGMLSSVEASSISISSAGVADATGATLIPHIVNLLTGGTNLILTGATSSAPADGFAVQGSSGADTVTGSDAADQLYGNVGNDTLNGGLGNDYVIGGAGADNLNGGGGDDLFYFDSVSEMEAGESIVGGDGFDEIRFGYSVYGTLDLSAANFSAVEELETQYNTHIKLTAGQLNGLGLSGIGQVTVVTAGVADMTGRNVSAGVFNLSVGGVTLNLSGNTGSGHEIFGSTGVDTVTAGALGDTLHGGDGADTLDGDAGGDLIYGDAGADTLRGGAGDDFLDGGLGADALNGGDGDDWLLINDSAVAGETYAGGAGFDTLQVKNGINLSAAVIGADVERLITDLYYYSDISLTAAQLSALSSLMVSGVHISTAGVVDLSDAYIDQASNWSPEFFLNDGGQTIILPTVTETGFYVGGGAGIDIVTGGGWYDHIVGGGGADILSGGASPDYIAGGLGADTLNGDAGNDQLYGEDGDDVVHGGAGNDELYGGVGVDILDGGDGDDLLIVENLADLAAGSQFIGGAGSDRLWYGGSTLDITGASLSGIESIYAYAATVIATAAQLDGLQSLNANSVTITTGGLVDMSAGGGPSSWHLSDEGNTLLFSTASGTGQNYMVYGGSGDDIVSGGYYPSDYFGGAGNDTLTSGGAGFRLYGEEGDDTLNGVGASDNLMGGVGNDILNGAGGRDLMDGGEGADQMFGGLGDDVYLVDHAGDALIEADGEGTDEVESSVTFTLSDNLEKLTLLGEETLDGTGNDTANTILGNKAVNTLDGAGGNDRLDGGLGADILIGGSGNDTFVIDATDQVLEFAGEGSDTVEVTFSYTLSSAYIENLTLIGSGSINGTGNAAANVINGNFGGNTLAGAAGNDVLNGGGGNDVLRGGEGSDTLDGGAGVDVADYSDRTVSVVVNLTPAVATATVGGLAEDTLTNIESVTGGSAADNLTGNSLANTLRGGAGADRLDGQGGVDQMYGGIDNDTYVVDHSADTAIETEGQGVDTVEASVSFTLGVNVENLTLTGAGAVNATGNTLDNRLIGNGAANVLDGGAGTDTADYFGRNAAVVVTLAGAADAQVTVGGVAEDTLRNIENLVGGGLADALTGDELGNQLSGRGGADTLSGAAGNDLLDGGEGADVMKGGLGDDVFIVDNAADVVSEAGGEGLDRVEAAISFTLGANVEALVLTGVAAINATGNAGANTLTGNGAANVFIGGAGADQMQGGGGVDTVSYVGAAGAVVVNLAAGTATGGADADSFSGMENATGSSFGDQITGNALANVLDGGAGADQMAGGLGDDTYYVDNAGDVLTEGVGAGTDTVVSSVNYTLSADLETLTLIATATTATGNDIANSLFGNTRANTLSGGGGDDQLFGLEGDDILRGGLGADALDGGDGLDTADYSDTTGAVAATLVAGGITIVTIDGIADDGLINVENITGGTGQDQLAGNALANRLLGGNGADILSGKAGADYLDGGSGADTADYADKTVAVVATLNGATNATVSINGIAEDTIRNIENLIGGAAADTLTGDGLANQLWGNGGNDTLNGGGGNDLLDGGSGADVMSGGVGNDVYVVNHLLDQAFEFVGEGVDRVEASVNFTLADNIENLTLTGTAANGTGNGLGNTLTGNSRANQLSGGDGADILHGMDGSDRLDGGLGVDTMVGGIGNDTYVVDNSLDVVTEVADGGTDTVEASASWTMGNVYVEKLTLTGAGAINGTGNSAINTINGNDAANTLSGLGGADTLYGNGGADTLFGGEGADYLYGGAGLDTLTGGASSDRFYFADGDTAGTSQNLCDRILDFSHTQRDRVALAGVDANTGLAGDQAFVFIGSAAFSGVAGQLRYEQTAGLTLITGDTNGDGVADFMIRLEGTHSLLTGDFIL
jgi:Ca2+-binding RTX toxin-like protein